MHNLLMIIKDPLYDWIGIINEILQVTNRKLLILTNTCLKVTGLV